MESISSKVRFSLLPYSAAHSQPVGAVQVAGRGRVKPGMAPRNIAVIFLPVFLLLWPTDDIRVEEEIFKGGL